MGTSGGGSSLREELILLNGQWSAALEAKDLDGIMSFFAEDAVLVAPGAHLLCGPEAIREGFEAVVARQDAAPTTFEPGHIWESGNLVVDVGTYSTANVPPQRGKYIVVWERQGDGSLKALVDAPIRG